VFISASSRPVAGPSVKPRWCGTIVGHSRRWPGRTEHRQHVGLQGEPHPGFFPHGHPAGRARAPPARDGRAAPGCAAHPGRDSAPVSSGSDSHRAISYPFSTSRTGALRTASPSGRKGNMVAAIDTERHEHAERTSGHSSDTDRVRRHLAGLDRPMTLCTCSLHGGFKRARIGRDELAAAFTNSSAYACRGAGSVMLNGSVMSTARRAPVMCGSRRRDGCRVEHLEVDAETPAHFLLLAHETRPCGDWVAESSDSPSPNHSTSGHPPSGLVLGCSGSTSGRQRGPLSQRRCVSTSPITPQPGVRRAGRFQ